MKTLVLVLATLLVSVGAEAKSKMAYGGADHDFEWVMNLGRGQSIEIKGVNGAIHADLASGDEVEVRATKRAKRSDPRDVRIEVNEHDEGVTICVVYPGPGNDCQPGARGSSNTRNNDVSIDFYVKVPEGVRLIGRTVNGSIDVEELESPVEAHTVNGSVRLSTTGTATATTVNGSVYAAVGSARWNEELEFTTVNGGIIVALPSEVRAAISASTMNGQISTDFPLRVRGKMGRRYVDGRIGESGGGDLSLSTVNGSIRLLEGE